MMNFLKDWIIQYQNKFLVGGVETTIDRLTGTVSQEGDTISAAYLNEIQKNCIYQVNATRVVEGVLEIYDITINGSEEFTPFNQTFLIDFSATNTQGYSLLRFNGNTYSLRFSDSITNGDIAPNIGFIPKRALVKLDPATSKAIMVGFNPNNFVSPAFTGTPTAPTATTGTNTTQLATVAYANAIAGGTTVPVVSKSANGYMKLANGMIIQWGQTASTGYNVTFPIAFDTACSQVFIIPQWNSPTSIGTYYFYVASKSTTGFNLGGNGGTTAGPVWFAIGY
jgi:hypothetical protein